MWRVGTNKATAGYPSFRAGDIVLVRGSARFSRLIRVFTKARGEAPTVVNHVGLMVSFEELVEAATTTVRHSFWSVYPRKNRVYVVRKRNITGAERALATQKALSYVGRKYGYLKLVAHGLDHLVFGDRYVARRLLSLDNYPICSWIVAWAYWHAGLSFGVAPEAASPDDIWDWVREKHPEEWEVVYESP